MGKLSSLKTISQDKVIVTLELTHNESLWLKGNIEDIHIFAENNLEYKTKLVQRGKKESTKYFLMPKKFKKGIKSNEIVDCNRIETENKFIYIFSTNKTIEAKINN